MLIGDCSLNSSFWDSRPVADSVQKKIREASVSIANFEAAVPNETPVRKTGPNIGADSDLFDALNSMSVDAVSLANNHAMDYGPSGLLSTIEACEDRDIETFGAGRYFDNAISPYECQIDGTTVGIFGLSEHEIGVADSDTAGVCWIRSPETLSNLEAMTTKYDVSIVVAHGGIEYVPLPPPSWRHLLRTIAEMDIDLIVGHHPHNAQGWEVYDGTPICYSLGNFLMYNEYFKGARWGYLVDAEVTNGEISRISLQLTEAQDGQVDLMASGTEPYRKYLHQSSRMVNDDQIYESHWQQIAQRLYDERYQARFADYGQGMLGMLVRHPMYTLDRVTRRVGGADVQIESQLGIVDHIANQSHRDVIQTALDLEIGRANLQEDDPVEDDSIEDDLDDLFAVIDGRDDRGTIRTWLDRVETVYERVVR